MIAPSPVTSSWPKCPTKLSEKLKNDFRRDGYLVFDDCLDADELIAAREEISRLVREMIDIGELSKHPRNVMVRHPNGTSMLQFEPGVDVETLDGAGLELSVRKLMNFCPASPWFENLSQSGPRIKGVLESMLGPDCIRFQDMALVKPAKIGTIKPWHQDNAYFAVAPLDQIIGVWIALDDATIENGCMHVILGGHLAGARKHYHDRDCEILPDRIDASQAVPIDLKAGGALFFSGMLPHETPPNTSDHRRRALQFHYRGAETQQYSQDEYNTLYAEADGTPASCHSAEESV
ncbi:MAG: phytanoyl-CoA dioxygenase family protein [Kiritimatiellae bacterium]|nr:phytanoyl-CoA dioxygenase family protein [Kiritimatiellia bacterium]